MVIQLNHVRLGKMAFIVTLRSPNSGANIPLTLLFHQKYQLKYQTSAK